MYGEVIEASEGGRALFAVGELVESVLVERSMSLLPGLLPLAVVAAILSNAASVTLCLSDEDNGERDLRFSRGDMGPLTFAIGDRR